MYVSGDIDSVRAKSEKFLARLLPLTCLSVKGNPYATMDHVKKIINDKAVKLEQLEAKRCKLWQASQTAQAEQQLMPFSRITIEINDTESMQMFLAFLLSAGTRFRMEENKHFHGLSDAHHPKECIAIEETPQWFLATFTDLQVHCPDANTWSYSFLSDWITRDDISLTETLSLIAQILTMHFHHGMTLSDIEGWLKGMGLNFTHSTVMSWIETGANILEPLDAPLHKEITTSGNTHGDESTLKCKDKRLAGEGESEEDVEDDLHYFKRWIFCYCAPLLGPTQFVFHNRGR